jgi:hypothetical protein
MRLSWINLLVAAVVFLVSCDESLPPRQDPSDLLNSQVSQYYLFTADSNCVIVNLVVVNKFDETLSDRMALEGAIVMTSNRDSSVHKTLRLDASCLKRGMYDPLKGTLTIDPGDTVLIQATWNFTDDAGKSLGGDNFFEYNVDPTCKQRLVSNPEFFTIDAKAKLFSKLGYVQSRIIFQIMQFDHFVDPKTCTPP